MLFIIENQIVIRSNTKKGFEELLPGMCFDATEPNSKTRRGRIQGNGLITPTLMTKCNVLYLEQKEMNEQIKTKVTGNLNLKGLHESITRVFDKNGISPTLCSGDAEKKFFENLRIRKLTPTECFRLMGLNDAESEKIISVVSDAQAYKMAGNSIVVNVLSNIFYRMLINTAPQENEQLQIF